MDILKKDIVVHVLKTPNPLAIRLVTNFPLKKEGKAFFQKKEEVPNTPLFLNLLSISGVEQIHVFENQITLSHNGTLKFEELEKKSEKIIKDFGKNHNSSFLIDEKKKPNKEQKKLSKIELKAEEILDRTIRPGLQADGGDLEIVSFKGNKIKISYQGACGGCPSSYMGTLEAIENILRYELKNEKLEVCPV